MADPNHLWHSHQTLVHPALLQGDSCQLDQNTCVNHVSIVAHTPTDACLLPRSSPQAPRRGRKERLPLVSPGAVVNPVICDLTERAASSPPTWRLPGEECDKHGTFCCTPATRDLQWRLIRREGLRRLAAHLNMPRVCAGFHESSKREQAGHALHWWSTCLGHVIL